MTEPSCGLRTIALELTRRCNLRCGHCLRSKGGRETDLPLALVTRVLDEARELNVPRITFTGGEPTVHPEFGALCQAIADRGLRYRFVTNGWSFPKVFPQIAPHVGDSLMAVCFSLDGARAETNDPARGAGTFRRTMQAIALCHARQVPFSLQVVVNTRNAGELEQIAFLGASLGASSVGFGFHQPSPSSVATGLVPSPAEQRRLRGRLRQLAELVNVHLELGAGFGDAPALMDCSSLAMQVVHVDCFGRLVLCCEVTGLDGEEPGEPEVVVDLKEVSLSEGLARVAERVAAFRQVRLRDYAGGRLNAADEFACWYCLRKLGKMDWLRREGGPWLACVDDLDMGPPARQQP